MKRNKLYVYLLHVNHQLVNLELYWKKIYAIFTLILNQNFGKQLQNVSIQSCRNVIKNVYAPNICLIYTEYKVRLYRRQTHPYLSVGITRSLFIIMTLYHLRSLVCQLYVLFMNIQYFFILNSFIPPLASSVHIISCRPLKKTITKKFKSVPR